MSTRRIIAGLTERQWDEPEKPLLVEDLPVGTPVGISITGASGGGSGSPHYRVVWCAQCSESCGYIDRDVRRVNADNIGRCTACQSDPFRRQFGGRSTVAWDPSGQYAAGWSLPRWLRTKLPEWMVDVIGNLIVFWMMGVFFYVVSLFIL